MEAGASVGFGDSSAGSAGAIRIWGGRQQSGPQARGASEGGPPRPPSELNVPGEEDSGLA